MSRRATIALASLLLSAAALCRGQDSADVPSLGDLARSVRKTKPADAQAEVIDNDNLTVMMDKAEGERLNGKPVFSIDPSGKSFRMTSPDGTCSLSFDAKATALISTPYVSSDLPQYEMEMLDGEAAVHDGVLEVKLHNGSQWEVKEIVVGLTLLKETTAGLQPARLITATEVQPEAKLPDVTSLLHLKATAPADSIMVFRGVVSDELSHAQNWHWALVAARGIPPAAPTSTPVPQISAAPQIVSSAPVAQDNAGSVPAQGSIPPSALAQPAASQSAGNSPAQPR
jgi:hypothetical protein